MPTFTQGFYYNQPSEKAPDFVLANVSIKPLEFIAWLSEQKQNEKGYVKIAIKRSKQGKVYAELDTWEPKKKETSGNETDNIPDDFFQR